MDAFVFIETEPGAAGVVTDRLVDAGHVARAAAVTGDIDVIARIDDISVEDLADRLLGGVQSVEGVRRSSTSLALPLSFFNPEYQMLLPVRLPPPPPPLMAFVLVELEAGVAADVAGVIQARSDVILGAALLTGAPDMLLLVGGDDFEAVARAVIENIQSIEGVASTSTSLILRLTPGPEEAA
jgi:DNA-binding Lrp family transcriptional regulator